MADLETAIDVVNGRLADARTKASVGACEIAKPEYGRRVAAICTALVSVAEARKAYADLIDEFERNDIAWLGLGPMTPRFLGDPRDGHLARYLMEAREAGYY
ncbi:hypothetical protein VQ044_14075 [Aurantimonas sp. C2-5-R2]|uniref:hypothetical protein n=1 Tax=Aurantimonas sp. C2-5-R2 TaxID=3113713 RepID=UPI002F9387C1